jgi:hypothetical protein
MSFIDEKQLLLDVLKKINCKLLFPQSVITSLKNAGLDTFSHFLSSYNSYIKKSRNLELELVSLEKWGIFFNSHTMWKMSISSVTAGYTIYTKEILNYIINADVINKMLLNQSNVNINHIKLFLNINKINSQYVINTTEPTVILRSNIHKLLPRCLLTSGTQLSLEEPHELDDSDIIFTLEESKKIDKTDVTLTLDNPLLC